MKDSEIELRNVIDFNMGVKGIFDIGSEKCGGNGILDEKWCEKWLHSMGKCEKDLRDYRCEMGIKTGEL